MQLIGREPQFNNTESMESETEKSSKDEKKVESESLVNEIMEKLIKLTNEIDENTDINSPEIKEKIGNFIDHLQEKANRLGSEERDLWFNMSIITMYQKLSSKNPNFKKYLNEAIEDFELILANSDNVKYLKSHRILIKEIDNESKQS